LPNEKIRSIDVAVAIGVAGGVRWAFIAAKSSDPSLQVRGAHASIVVEICRRQRNGR